MIGRNVTVLGAGIAGLAVARAFALRGATVTVLEQAEAVREAGAGIQISPNGARVISALGLREAFEQASLPSQAAELLNGETGKRVAWLPVGAEPSTQGAEAPAGYRLIHRARLIDLLAQGAREVGVRIRLLQRVKEVDLSGARPKVIMATGSELETDLLIGADGLHSRTRIALNGAQVPFFTQQICWRAIIPDTEADIEAEAATPPRAVAQVFMGDGRHLVSYPLKGGLRNIVAVEERNRWVEENYSLSDDPARLREAFKLYANIRPARTLIPGGRYEEIAKARHLQRPTGLNGALQLAGMHFCGQQHRALEDARNTARLLPLTLPAHSP